MDGAWCPRVTWLRGANAGKPSEESGSSSVCKSNSRAIGQLIGGYRISSFGVVWRGLGRPGLTRASAGCGVTWSGVAYLSETAFADNDLEVEMVLAKLRVI